MYHLREFDSPWCWNDSGIISCDPRSPDPNDTVAVGEGSGRRGRHFKHGNQGGVGFRER